MESRSLENTVPAAEQDNRLSAHIARAREKAEHARRGIRWRVGGTWVTVDDPWKEPEKPVTRVADRES